jgi:hypothetical protein
MREAVELRQRRSRGNRRSVVVGGRRNRTAMKRSSGQRNRHDLASSNCRVELANRRDVVGCKLGVGEENGHHRKPSDIEVPTGLGRAWRCRRNMVMAPYTGPVNPGNHCLRETRQRGTVVRTVIPRLVLAVHGADLGRYCCGIHDDVQRSYRVTVRLLRCLYWGQQIGESSRDLDKSKSSADDIVVGTLSGNQRRLASG